MTIAQITVIATMLLMLNIIVVAVAVSDLIEVRRHRLLYSRLESAYDIECV
jgi:hypothetical protein